LTAAGLRLMCTELEHYADVHQIALNPDKSQLLTVGDAAPPVVTFKGRSIPQRTELTYLGFDLQLHSKGRSLRVSEYSVIRKFFAASNSILCLPRLASTSMRVQLISTFAMPIVDFVLQLYDHLSVASVKRLQIAVNKVAKRAYGLHRSCSTNITCATTGWFPINIRAGQLRILPCRLAGALVLGDSLTDRVTELRLCGFRARTAAHHIFTDNCSTDHAHRAAIIRALLAQPDPYARAMAYNISVPSCL